MMPAIDFPGADAGVMWNDLSPRIGVTYDLRGDGRTVSRRSYATYYGQMAPGQLSSELAATGAVFVRYPWTDTNGDGFVQAGEVNTSVPFLSKSNAYDPANPTELPVAEHASIRTSRTIARASSSSASTARSARQMAFGASYIWRKYDRSLERSRQLDERQLPRRQLHRRPTCPAGARCEPVTYFEPTIQIAVGQFVHTNVPDRYRDFNGFELTFRSAWRTAGR